MAITVRVALRRLRSHSFLPDLAARIEAAMHFDPSTSLRWTSLAVDRAPVPRSQPSPGWRPLIWQLHAPLASPHESAVLGGALQRAAENSEDVEPLDIPEPQAEPAAFEFDPQADLRLSFLTPLEWQPGSNAGSELAVAFADLARARFEQVYGRTSALPDDAFGMHMLAHFAQDGAASGVI